MLWNRLLLITKLQAFSIEFKFEFTKNFPIEFEVKFFILNFASSSSSQRELMQINFKSNQSARQVTATYGLRSYSLWSSDGNPGQKIFDSN